MSKPQAKITRRVLSHKEVIALNDWLKANRERIVRERMTAQEAADAANRALGTEAVSPTSVKGLADEHGIEFARGGAKAEGGEGGEGETLAALGRIEALLVEIVGWMRSDRE